MSRAILKSPVKNKTWTLALLLTLVALGYGLFEIWAEHGGPDESQKIELANESINSALQNTRCLKQTLCFKAISSSSLQNNT